MTNVSNNKNSNYIPGIETQASSHSKDKAKQENNKTRHIGKLDNIVNEVFEVKGENSKSIGTNFRDSSIKKLGEGANKNITSSVNNCFVTSSKKQSNTKQKPNSAFE